MTDFIDFPEFSLSLPEDGKIRGNARLVVRGKTGVILTGSESRILSPTGKEYTVSLELVCEDGVVMAAPGNGQRGQAFTGTFADRWKSAPTTHADKMTEALIVEAQKVWDGEAEARGRIASASQALYGLERDRVKAQEALTQIIDAQVMHQQDLAEAQALIEKEN